MKIEYPSNFFENLSKNLPQEYIDKFKIDEDKTLFSKLDNILEEQINFINKLNDSEISNES